MKKKILNICYVIYGVTLIYALFINFGKQYFFMTLVSIFTPMIIPMLFKLLNMKINEEVYILNIVFVYFASLVGSCLGGYSTAYFDKFVHCGSGVVILELAYLIYKYYIKENKKLFMFLFLNAFNMMIAFLWELYEYLLLVFFNYDAIRHYSMGVHDTMTDMIVCFIGGLVLSLYLVKYDQSKDKHFFVSLQRDLFEMNHFYDQKA